MWCNAAAKRSRDFKNQLRKKLRSDSQIVCAIVKNGSFYVIYHRPRLTVTVFSTLNYIKNAEKCCKIKQGFWWGLLETPVRNKLIGCGHRPSQNVFRFSFWLIWCFTFENRPVWKNFIKVRPHKGKAAAEAFPLFWWDFDRKQTHRHIQTHR